MRRGGSPPSGTATAPGAASTGIRVSTTTLRRTRKATMMMRRSRSRIWRSWRGSKRWRLLQHSGGPRPPTTPPAGHGNRHSALPPGPGGTTRREWNAPFAQTDDDTSAHTLSRPSPSLCGPGRLLKQPGAPSRGASRTPGRLPLACRRGWRSPLCLCQAASAGGQLTGAAWLQVVCHSPCGPASCPSGASARLQRRRRTSRPLQRTCPTMTRTHRTWLATSASFPSGCVTQHAAQRGSWCSGAREERQ